MQIKVQVYTALLVGWMREDEESGRVLAGKACLVRRAKASASKKLLQVADKIESDAPHPRANSLRYECILACAGSLTRTFARYLPSCRRAPGDGERWRRGEVVVEEVEVIEGNSAEHFLNYRFERNFRTVSEVFLKGGHL